MGSGGEFAETSKYRLIFKLITKLKNTKLTRHFLYMLLYDGFILLNMNSKKKAQELFDKHGFEIANSIIDTMLDENLPEFNQSKIDFWLDVKNDLKRISLAIAS